MRLVTSRDKTCSKSVVRKEPEPIRAKRRVSAAIRVEWATAILTESETKGPAKLAFAEDFLWEHSFSLAQGGSPDNPRRAGKSDSERSAPNQLFGFCS